MASGVVLAEAINPLICEIRTGNTMPSGRLISTKNLSVRVGSDEVMA